MRWVLIFAASFLVAGAELLADDCNGNGIPDGRDVAPALRFVSARMYPVGTGPESLAAGDLDGDGKLDLVTANRFSKDLSVLRNAGRGEFDAEERVAIGPEPRSVAIADLDGDGDADVAVAYSFAVVVLRNEGNGRLAPATQLPVGSKVVIIRNQSTPPASADGDADGIPDECQQGLYTFIRGDANSDGTVEISDAVFAVRHLFAAGPAPRCARSADINRDGTLDIADAVALLKYLFLVGPPPPEPYPSCDLDPTRREAGSTARCRPPAAAAVEPERDHGTKAARPRLRRSGGLSIEAGGMDPRPARQAASANHFPNHFARDVGEAFVAAVVTVREMEVVQAE